MAKLDTLEKQRAWVEAEIAKEQEKDRRVALANSAYSKLREALARALTEEEQHAVAGMYLFLHRDGGSALLVDLVRNIPSITDRGQGAELDRLLAVGSDNDDRELLEVMA